MTKAEATGVLTRAGFNVRLEFDTGTARLEHRDIPSTEAIPEMTVAEFIAYARGFKEGVKFGYEGYPPE